MAHFKRRRCKRQIRNTQDTKYRWVGNSRSVRMDGGRFKAREYDREAYAREEGA